MYHLRKNKQKQIKTQFPSRCQLTRASRVDCCPPVVRVDPPPLCLTLAAFNFELVGTPTVDLPLPLSNPAVALTSHLPSDPLFPMTSDLSGSSQQPSGPPSSTRLLSSPLTGSRWMPRRTCAGAFLPKAEFLFWTPARRRTQEPPC